MGAWIETYQGICRDVVGEVAPYVGAWIETKILRVTMPLFESHPMWVRGLKLWMMRWCIIRPTVAPYVGAWIETECTIDKLAKVYVAPYVGAWIETHW